MALGSTGFNWRAGLYDVVGVRSFFLLIGLRRATEVDAVW